MKLKFLAAAAALLCAATAHAAINKIDNNAELFFVVWDESFATYTLDTGLTLGTLLGQSTAKSWSFNTGAKFDAYKALDKDLNDFTQFTGTRYALFAVDDNLFTDGLDTYVFQYLTTTTGGVMPSVTESQLSNITIDKMGEFVARQNQAGGNPGNVALNVDVTVDNTSEAHFLETTQYGGQQGLFAGNAINSGLTSISYCAADQFLGDPFARATCSMKNSAGLEMSTSFDGTSFSVTAVPEPGTYALLLAGLATIGFAARRRLRG